MEHFDKHELQEASSILSEALVKDSNFVRAWYMQGEIMVKRGMVKDALTCYQKVIGLCPDYNRKIYFFLGNLSYYEQDFKNCEFYLNQFLQKADSTEQNYTGAGLLCSYCKAAEKLVKNPVQFEPVLMREVSTLADEFMPVFSPDNQLLFYTKKHWLEYDEKEFAYKKEMQLAEEIFISKKENGKFTSGTKLDLPFNNGLQQGKCALTINNKEMYISICDYEKCEGKAGCDIFYTEFKNGGWEPFRNLNEFSDSAINTTYWESHISLSPDGNMLFFSSDQGSEGKNSDIYYVLKDSNGKWSAPINLGPVVNTDGEEMSPFIHQDNSTLYFASNGHEGLGGYDLFVTRRDSNGNWSIPLNLGYPINTENDEYNLLVSVDGENGYIASNQYPEKVGGWDLYSFHLHDKIKPQKVLFLRGSLLDEEGDPLKKPLLVLKNLESGTEIPIKVDEEGYYGYVKETDHYNYSLTALSEGYFYDSKLLTKDSKNSGALQFHDFHVPRISPGVSFKMDNITFATNAYDLSQQVKLSLDPLISFLQINKKVHISIEGHTDSQGDDYQNKILSENRAKSVYNYIAENGISSSRLGYKGFGESRPLASNDSEEGRSLNRRTEVKITKQ